MLQLRSVEALLLQAMLGVGDVDEARQRLERLDQAMVNKRTELLVEEAKGLREGGLTLL
jgi:hypothetical protein